MQLRPGKATSRSEVTRSHASSTRGPDNGGDLRQVTIKYSATTRAILYLGTFSTAAVPETVGVAVDPAQRLPNRPCDLYLDEYGGTTANVVPIALAQLRDHAWSGDRSVREERGESAEISSS